ncbi:MAG TPA: nucleotidyltransferase domain-containing protein [Thermoanaerobaculia bacterium]|nr:nucleotidyltransferase domain-containing protein [Thermoanaerobaculia bacterium]
MTDRAVETALRDFFARDPHGCAAVYLFGSRARDDWKEGSDVDVGVLLESEPEPGLKAFCFDLQYELEDDLKRKVDLVVLNHASAELRHYVLRGECLILDRDPSRRIQFEVQTRREYFDLLPILLRYRKLAS